MRYTMADGTRVNTRKAKQRWREGMRWDGHHYISLATDAHWASETLFLSPAGRYYIEWRARWQEFPSIARWVEMSHALAWLTRNGHSIPESLMAIANNEYPWNESQY